MTIIIKIIKRIHYHQEHEPGNENSRPSIDGSKPLAAA